MIIRVKKHIANDSINNRHINVEGKRRLSWLKLCKQGIYIRDVVVE